jgi:hypothetical protein
MRILDPTHPAFLGAWVLDEEGAVFALADEFRGGAEVSDAP